MEQTEIHLKTFFIKGRNIMSINPFFQAIRLEQFTNEESNMSNSAVKKVSSTDFKSTIEKGLILVDFFAEWCAPCRMQVPVLEELAEEMKEQVNVCKLDIDQAQDIAQEYQVTSVPTLILFKDGKEINRTVGLHNLDQLKELVLEAN